MPRKHSRRAALAALVPLLSALFFTAAGAASVAPGSLSFKSAAYEADEGAAVATITLSRAGGTSGEVTAKVSVADGTAGAADYLKPGEEDPSFASRRSDEFHAAESLALQPDGKIIVGEEQYVVRLNPDGGVDATFRRMWHNGRVKSIVVRPDGKILIAGSFSLVDLNFRPRSHVALLNPDGTLDDSFKPATPETVLNTVNAAALLPDGKVMLASQFIDASNRPGPGVVRLNADGSLDNGFAPTGETEGFSALAVQPDGKVLAGGGLHLFRYNTDGSVDTTFNGGVSPAGVSALALRPDGKVLIAGFFTQVNGVARSNMALLNPDGSLDVSFDPGAGPDNTVRAIVLQPDGKALVGGYFNTYDGVARRGVVRVNADGSLDTTFVPALAQNAAVEALIMQRDGRVVAAGGFFLFVRRLVGDLFATWGDGDAADKTVKLLLADDALEEADETLSLTLSPLAGGASAGATTSATLTIHDDDATTGPTQVRFAAPWFRASENDGAVTVTVERSGNASSQTSVGYATAIQSPAPGLASDRSDYSLAYGTLRFAAGERSKSFQVFITDDNFFEADETLQVVLADSSGGSLGTPSSATITILDEEPTQTDVNPVFESFFFVRQHYRDFLNREPDAAGLAFWVNELGKCGSNDEQCREVKRVNVSAAFFLSIEFQQTGVLVYRLNQAAFDSGERLDYSTFVADTQEIGRGLVVGSEGWEARLEANKQAFVDAFVERPEFVGVYPPALTPERFVDALDANTRDPLNPSAGGSLTQGERDRLVADLTSGAKTRAQVLRAVAENAEFQRRQFAKAFVLMQYFGYLRRAPSEPPDDNFDGYNFWLQKLNSFGGDFVRAEMVKAFINSDEYRQRFGP